MDCCNDIMNNVECVIKRDVYRQKMHSCSKNIRGILVFCSKNIRGISVFVLKISVVYGK